MNQGQSTHLGRLVHGLATYLRIGFVRPRLAGMVESVVALALLDLEPARPVLEACYSGRKGGRPPRDPVAMLRSLVLMAPRGVTSFNQWAARLAGRPELALLSDFEPDDTPGVGTFYDLCHRLLDGPYRKPCEHFVRHSKRLRGTRGRFRRNLKQERREARARRQAELAHDNEGRVKAAVRQVMPGLGEAIRSQELLDRVEQILMACAVVPSARLGLLGDISKLIVAGDGTSLYSGAAAWGRPMCSCEQRGCDCDRLYSDPSATWGWDSHREQFCFGHRLHALSTSAAGVDLPLHLDIAGAHEPDVTMAVDAVARFHRRLAEFLPEAHIAYGLFDAGYDATGFYRLLHAVGATPVIPLAQQSKSPQDSQGLERDDDGVPLCPGGARKWRHSYNKSIDKVVFACPAKRQRRKRGKLVFVWDQSRCPNATPCEPESKMGPLTLLPVGDDPRLNPPLSRSSERFRQLYNQRSGAERVFSQIKTTGGLARRPWRHRHLFHIGTLAHALGIHARAWMRQRLGEHRPADADELLSLLEQLAGQAEGLAAAA